MNVKKNLLAAVLLSVGCLQFSMAQKPSSSASNDIRLDISSETGTNGVAVAYNPKKDLYYTAFAGNASYEIEVFNGQGFSVFKKEIGGDVRGMWFNSAKNQLEGILYNNEGSFTMKIGSDGFPGEINLLSFVYNRGEQDVATSNGSNVFFVDYDGFHIYKAGKKKCKNVAFADNISLDSYNLFGIVYTGVSGYELGLYNFIDNSLDLFSQKSGKMTASVKLSIDDDIVYPEMFRASYCNGRLFLFDVDMRYWHGFTIF